MRSNAETAALEQVFAAAQNLRAVWRGANHCDDYVRAINAVAKEVDAAEAAIAKARKSPAKRKARR